MALVLAKISPVVLAAVRERPALVTQLLSGEAADVFTADIDELERAAAEMTTRAWFDTAVNGTESLGYDEFTYGPAFALDVAHVRAVSANCPDLSPAPRFDVHRRYRAPRGIARGVWAYPAIT
jgi:hypothetical protein